MIPDPEVLGFAAFFALVAVLYGLRLLALGRPDPVPAAAPSTAAGADIPELCVRRGHAVRLVRQNPRTFACAHDGCTHTPVVDEEVQS